MGITISEASRSWGVSRTTIHNKIKQKLLSKNENGLIDPSEMSRVFGSPKKSIKTNPSVQHGQELNSTEQQWTHQTTLFEHIIQFEQQRNEDLQKQLKEAKERLQTQEAQIFELLATIKELSQGIKQLEAPKTPQPRKRFLGIF